MKFCCIILLTLALGCVNNIEDIESIYADNIIHDYGSDIEMNYYLKGNLEFQLLAPETKTIYFPNEETIFPKGIKVFVYNENLDTIATISSDFAIQNKDEKIVEVRKMLF